MRRSRAEASEKRNQIRTTSGRKANRSPGRGASILDVLAIISLALLSEFAGGGIYAAAPSNDTCGGAEVIPSAGPFPYLTAVTADITDATSTGDPAGPTCQPDISRGIWYQFTPSVAGDYIISSCADSPTGTTVNDTVIAVYTSTGGCGGALTEVTGSCDDDSCGTELLQAISIASLDAATPYYILVWQVGPTAPTTGNTAVQLRIAPVGPPPANDTCAGAETIPASGPFPYLTSTTTDITGATTTDDPSLPSCQVDVSRSVWYAFTPATPGTYTVSTCAGAAPGSTVDDTVLAIFTSTGGCGGVLSQVGGWCDDDSCTVKDRQSVLTRTLDGGTTYYILVWQVGATPPIPGRGGIQLRVSQGLPPANDTCGGAEPLVLDTPASGTTALASDDYRLSGSVCFTGLQQTASTAAGRDAAYAFTAPSTDSYSFRVTNYTSSLNLVTYLASTCETGPPPVVVSSCLAASNRNAASSAEEAMCIPLTTGQTVYAFVDENALTAGSPFRIEVNRCVRETEPNDTPASANAFVCGMEGSVGVNAEADFIALGSPPAGSRVFAQVDGVAANLDDFDLRITTSTDTLEYDDNNNDLAFGGFAPNVAGTPVPGGAIFARVSYFSSIRVSEPYRLVAAVRPPIADATVEVEPNGTIVEANTGAGDYFSGAIASSNDLDLFAFEATAGELLLIGLDGDPLRNNTPINATLTLLDAGGAALLVVGDAASTSSTTTGAGTLTSKTPNSPGETLTYRVTASGTYYARVAATSAGDYLLSIAHDCGIALPADGDGDGVDDPLDCAPADPTAFAIPGEVSNLDAQADGVTMTWTSAAPGAGTGTVYDVLGGSLVGLPVGGAGIEECVASQWASLSASASTTPPAGTGFWYVVRARNACGTGPYGSDSSGVPRASATCP